MSPEGGRVTADEWFWLGANADVLPPEHYRDVFALYVHLSQNLSKTRTDEDYSRMKGAILKAGGSHAS